MKKIWVLIGPSGSGKSTIANKIKLANSNRTIATYSFDELRLKWYSDDYSEAWEASVKDKEFKQKSVNEFELLLQKGVDIIVDNCNLTPKSRKMFITEAKKRGYTTYAVKFNNQLQTLIERQTIRPDKCVPTHAVIQQFNSLVEPTEQEFDVVLNSTDI